MTNSVSGVIEVRKDRFWILVGPRGEIFLVDVVVVMSVDLSMGLLIILCVYV